MRAASLRGAVLASAAALLILAVLVTTYHNHDEVVLEAQPFPSAEGIPTETQDRARTVVKRFMGLSDEDGMELELHHLMRQYTDMQKDLRKQKKTLRGAKPRIITVDVRPRGNPGPPGNPGPQGGVGDPGRAGKEGPRGAPGAPGPRGVTGVRGKRGYRGRPGRVGPEGLPGRRGPPGRPGEQGDRGLPGTRGAPGAAGAPGPNGHDGQRGPPGWSLGPGKRGKHGVRGPRGPPGPIGEPGIRGVKGRTGGMGERGPRGRRGPKGIPGRIGADRTFNPFNGLNIGDVKSKRVLGGYARKNEVQWPQNSWSLATWVYVGKHAPKGATPFSYEADGQPRVVTLTDRCSQLYLDNEKIPTGFKCEPGRWTHVIIAYNGQQITTYKNGKTALTFRHPMNVPSGGELVLGQDNNNAEFAKSSALAPGQIGAPQLFSSYLTPGDARRVKDGQLKGNVLHNMDGYSVNGAVNFDFVPARPRQHHLARKHHHKKGKKDEHRHGEHREGEHREGEHREGEHREGEHGEGEHREGEHREGEHGEGERREGEHREGEHREGEHREGEHGEGEHEHKEGEHHEGEHHEGEHHEGERRQE